MIKMGIISFIHLFTRKWMSGIIFNFHSFFLSIFYCEVGGRGVMAMWESLVLSWEK